MNNSAPGPTGIPYIALKNLTEHNLQHILKLFNLILQTGNTPREWSNGTIYPIPKPKDWENNINITRPITLLESIRKIFTKCINDRLSLVLTNHPILSPHNWAVLSGSSTQEPIHIIQAIIEDAKDYNRQAWILSLDMSKAYDSVNNTMLYKALQRVKVSAKITQIIQSLLTVRKNTVITVFGPTSEYIVQDGIDQGDTISPLLWRIFYDPLLSYIDNKYEGYTLSATTCADIREGEHMIQEEVKITAFMDDITITKNQCKH